MPALYLQCFDFVSGFLTKNCEKLTVKCKFKCDADIGHMPVMPVQAQSAGKSIMRWLRDLPDWTSGNANDVNVILINLAAKCFRPPEPQKWCHSYTVNLAANRGRKSSLVGPTRFGRVVNRTRTCQVARCMGWLHRPYAVTLRSVFH